MGGGQQEGEQVCLGNGSIWGNVASSPKHLRGTDEGSQAEWCWGHWVQIPPYAWGWLGWQLAQCDGLEHTQAAGGLGGITGGEC